MFAHYLISLFGYVRQSLSYTFNYNTYEQVQYICFYVFLYACLPYSMHNLVHTTRYGYTTITDPNFVSKLHLNYSHHNNLPSYMPPIGMGPTFNGTHALFIILICFFLLTTKSIFFHYFSVWHLGNHYLQFIIHV